MAQTWPPKKWKQRLLSAIDSVGRPVARAVGRGARPRVPTAPRILVVELWQIGDVVLVTPVLSALRLCFPDATIALLGKPHAELLLQGSGLVDEVLIAELPWTRPARKYHPADYDWRAIRGLIRTLRVHRFDVTFDARMDLRSNILVALSGAKRRIGFQHGGGDWLLTDAVPIDPEANHKIEDWLALLQPVACRSPEKPRCALTVLENERVAIAAVLASHFDEIRSLIGIHPGGSHPGKRWPLDRFVSLTSELASEGHQLVVFQEPSGYGGELAGIPGVLALRLELRDMMAAIEQCATLVCNDSGPMHIAAALGVPTVAIFECGEPRWFGPIGEGHIVIAGESAGVDVSAAPIDQPPPNPVPVHRVKEAVLSQLERHRTIIQAPASRGDV